MIKIENVVLPSPEQWQAIIMGTRNPLNSWARSDSGTCMETLPCHSCESNRKTECHASIKPGDFIVGPNDQKLMMTLRNAGTDHRKFMRMIVVYLDITGPLYWWKEFDTYKIGSVANSCSTMHKIHAKEFTLDDFSNEHLYSYQAFSLLGKTITELNNWRALYVDTKDKKYWWQMIQLLPSSYNQKRTVMLNYEVLCNMYKSRRNHKLDEWNTLCDWMETLPYSELITGERKQPNWTPSDQGRILNYILENDPRRDVENVAVRIAHPSPYIVDYVAVRYDDPDAKRVWYSFDMTKVSVAEALDAVKEAIAKMAKNGLALGA